MQKKLHYIIEKTSNQFEQTHSQKLVFNNAPGIKVKIPDTKKNKIKNSKKLENDVL